MYVIGLPASYHWPVKVQHAKDGGGFETRTFDASFKRLTEEEVNRISSLAAKGEMNNQDVCKAVLCGWRGIAESAGAEPAELPYSQVNQDRILSIQGIPGAIVNAWFESLRGEKEKN